MRAIRIDYAQRPTPRWPGVVLLVVASLAAVVVSFQYVSVTRSLADTQIVLSRMERRAARAGEPMGVPVEAGTQVNAAVQRAGELVRKLSVPWEKLFAALDAMRNDQVALLIVEPDAVNGTVRITAEAKDVAVMTEYIETLRDSGVLPDAVLNNHQIVQQNPYKPVRFAFAGTWIAKP